MPSNLTLQAEGINNYNQQSFRNKLPVLSDDETLVIACDLLACYVEELGLGSLLRTDVLDTIDNSTGVEVDTDNSVIMFCPKCGSQFVYTDGTPIQGPARSPLRQYNAVYSGGMLHVYN